MASIIKKKIRGQIYYYAVESKRVDGKPRIVWQKYLGKVADILNAVNGMENLIAPEAVRVYDFGVEAGLLAMARRLDLVGIINRHLGWKGEGCSYGEHLLLYAINISVAPAERLPEWFEGAMLRHHFPAGSRVLTEKRFWNTAEHLNPDTIKKIQDELVHKIADEFGVGSGALVYSGIKLPATAEGRPRESCTAATYMGILATEEFAVPLFYDTYSADPAGGEAVERVTINLIERYRDLGYAAKDVTVVETVLNNSMEVVFRPSDGKSNNILYVKDAGEFEDSGHPLERFHILRPSRAGKTKVFRTSKKMGAKNVAVLVVYSEKDFARQMEELRSEVQRCLKELRKLKSTLADSPVAAGMLAEEEMAYGRKCLEAILGAGPTRLQNLIEISLTAGEGGRPILDYKFDDAGLAHLGEKFLGRTVLVTDCSHWGNEEIYGAYLGLRELEEAVGRMKLRPGARLAVKSERRTSVYAFCLVLALILQSLLTRELHRCGVTGGLNEILKLLSEMREVSVTYAKGETRFRKKEYSTIAELDPRQKEIYDCLRLGQFVEGGDFEDT